MTITCPHCGAEETTTIVDEKEMSTTCHVCGLIGLMTDEAKIEIVEAKQHFNGELMECMMCGRKQQHVVGTRSQWTLVGEEPFLCYVCPGCLQESEQAKRGRWATVYQKVLRRYLRLRDRHLRGLNN